MGGGTCPLGPVAASATAEWEGDGRDQGDHAILPRLSALYQSFQNCVFLEELREPCFDKSCGGGG